MADSLVEGWNYVTVTDVCGSLTDSILVTVALPLAIDITSSSPASCTGGNNGSATVTVTNGASSISYLWTSGNTNAFATDLTTGWQYVTVTDACTSLVDSVDITALPVLSATITFSVPASCPTTADGKATVTVTNGAPPFTYVWSNSTSTGFVAMDLPTGWQYVTVNDACGFAVDSIQITSQPALSASVVLVSTTSCPNDSDGVANVVPVNGVSPFTYVWSESADVDSLASDLPAVAQYVVVTDLCGSDTVNFTMTSTPAMSLSIEKENVACYAQANAEITITPLDGVGPFTFVWADTILTDSTRLNLASGIYYVTVNDACGSMSDSVIISQPGNLSPSIIATDVTFTGLTDGGADLIISGGNPPYTFGWSNSSVMEDLTAVGEGTYYVTITDENGCSVTDSVVIATAVTHINIRNAFTPNGDGKNDVWNIEYISAFPDCTVLLYNEWGQKIFESTGYDVPWDGTRNGKEMPAATYYYIIDLKDGSTPYTGSVTLIR
jgi:gliding motility-associated-like protein